MELSDEKAATYSLEQIISMSSEGASDIEIIKTMDGRPIVDVAQLGSDDTVIRYLGGEMYTFDISPPSSLEAGTVVEFKALLRDRGWLEEDRNLKDFEVIRALDSGEYTGRECDGMYGECGGRGSYRDRETVYGRRGKCQSGKLVGERECGEPGFQYVVSRSISATMYFCGDHAARNGLGFTNRVAHEEKEWVTIICTQCSGQGSIVSGLITVVDSDGDE